MTTTATEFWVVWNEAGRPPTFKHPTVASAEAEAERLARTNPGQTFHVLALRGSCTYSNVVWARVPEEMPF